MNDNCVWTQTAQITIICHHNQLFTSGLLSTAETEQQLNTTAKKRTTHKHTDGDAARAARLVCSIRLRRSHSSAAATGPPVWSGRLGLAVDAIIRQRSDASPVRRAAVISATTPVRCTTRISPRSTALCYVHCRASPSSIESWSNPRL